MNVHGASMVVAMKEVGLKIARAGRIDMLIRILRSSPSCYIRTTLLPMGDSARNRDGGEALGHLCIRKIELAVRRVIGVGCSGKWRLFESSSKRRSGVAHQGARTTQPHAPRVSPVTLTEPGRGAWDHKCDSLRI